MVPLLAEAPPFSLPITPDQISQLFISAQLFGALVAVGSMVLIGVSIWDKLRRKPTVDQEFATKVEIAALESRLAAEQHRMQAAHREDMGKVYDNLRALTSTVDQSMRDVARALGRLEGMGDISEKIASAFHSLVENLPCSRARRDPNV